MPDEQGVVLRFGKFIKTTQPGLNYHIPFPVERVLTPKVTKVNRIDVGFRSASDTGRTSGVGDVPEESLMLTGDENIVDIDYSVFWVIKDAGKFLFNIQSPLETVKAASETAMREAEKILQEAEAYKKQVVAAAEGEASRFIAIYNEYKSAKQVTQERMYLETMEKVLADIDKVIIDKSSGSGVVPYLPLPEIKKKTTN